MSGAVLVTGASGALGPHLVAELLRRDGPPRVFVLLRSGRRGRTDRVRALRASIDALTADNERPPSFDRLIPITGDILHADLDLDGSDRDRVLTDVDVVIHAAAQTRFTAPAADLNESNVQGTRHVLDLARRCLHLEQFLLVSTTCVAGTATGSIAERLEDESPEFVNAYERTKSEAERLAAAAQLPLRIARLSTCVGGERTGYVHRFGAIHQLLYWLTRGLLPVVPATEGARIDLIATDVGARWLARAAAQAVDGLEVCHVAAGERAIPLRELLECAVGHLRAKLPGWRNGQIEPPAIVDAATFRLFERVAAASRDVPLARVLEAGGSFLPALLYPKVYQTCRAERVWDGPLSIADWRSTLGRVIDFGIAHEWRRRPIGASHG
jgi:nucleoside-diphosphate-sugar epimerase